MARSARYSSSEAEDKIRRNPDADTISRRLRKKTLERIEHEERSEIIEDPLAMLIEDARSIS